VPELRNVPAKYIHDVWNLPQGLQKMSKVQIGGSSLQPGFECLYPRALDSRYTTKEQAKAYVKGGDKK